jgi:tRNA(fMet)-specific endonuclease VapC
VLVLDTDHLAEFDDASAARARLNERLLASGEELAATIVSVKEQFRGWLAQIHRLHADPYAQIPAYARLQRRLEFSPALDR